MRDLPTAPYEPDAPPEVVKKLRERVLALAWNLGSITTSMSTRGLRKPTIWLTNERVYWGEHTEFLNRGYYDLVFDTASITDGEKDHLLPSEFGKLLFNRHVGSAVVSELTDALVWSRDRTWRGLNNHNELQLATHFGKIVGCVRASVKILRENGTLN